MPGWGWDSNTAHRVHRSFLVFILFFIFLPGKGGERERKALLRERLQTRNVMAKEIWEDLVCGGCVLAWAQWERTRTTQEPIYVLYLHKGVIFTPDELLGWSERPSVDGECEVHSWSAFDLVSSERNPADTLPSLSSPELLQDMIQSAVKWGKAGDWFQKRVPEPN